MACPYDRSDEEGRGWRRRGVPAALCRHRSSKLLEVWRGEPAGTVWRGKPAATSHRTRFFISLLNDSVRAVGCGLLAIRAKRSEI